MYLYSHVYGDTLANTFLKFFTLVVYYQRAVAPWLVHYLRYTVASALWLSHQLSALRRVRYKQHTVAGALRCLCDSKWTMKGNYEM